MRDYALAACYSISVTLDIQYIVVSHSQTLQGSGGSGDLLYTELLLIITSMYNITII